jgi:hypothetical protein
MNKHSHSILKFCLLIVLVLSSGCEQLKLSDSQNAFRPQGIFFYSDYTAIYSYDFQTRENKVIFTGNPIELAIGNASIYFRGTTEPSTKLDLYKINWDG